ncbi:hypothetical protein L7F22_068554 [Adiantum nelumboides]|nr:hypothetical protein [Adiantum nelumboides]
MESRRSSFLILIALHIFCFFVPPSLAQSCASTYTVQSGDNCYAIAQANGIALADLQSWNPSVNCDILQIGQQLCLSAPSSSSPTPTLTGNGKVFREYIGALWNGVSLTDMPINSNVEVHFILSFAIDSPTNGQFAAFWDTNHITPDAVKALKSQYSNVKVMLSLGGDTVNGNYVQFQTASGVDSWVANAVSSLTSLIQSYGLDGVDVDYEHFDATSDGDFASAIGQLITQLKQNGVISVASIAPFDGVREAYTALWAQYSSVFDYVNFQFYTYGAATTAAQFVSYYNAAAATYSGGKVLASFTTADGASSVSPVIALATCQQLKASNSLPGIFIWSADNSFVSAAAPNFEYEQQAQALLA